MPGAKKRTKSRTLRRVKADLETDLRWYARTFHGDISDEVLKRLQFLDEEDNNSLKRLFNLGELSIENWTHWKVVLHLIVHQVFLHTRRGRPPNIAAERERFKLIAFIDLIDSSDEESGYPLRPLLQITDGARHLPPFRKASGPIRNSKRKASSMETMATDALTRFAASMLDKSERKKFETEDVVLIERVLDRRKPDWRTTGSRK